MDDALAQWLALREPADTASRSVDLTRAIANATRGRDPLRVLDLATGTGANIRYLMNRFPVRHQQWLAVDHSPTLLAQLPIRMSRWGAECGYEVATSATGCVVRDSQVECHVETGRLDLDPLDV